jgi:hypothetical protein
MVPIMRNYNIQEEIGKGGFGTVMITRKKGNQNKTYVVK